MGHAIRDIPSLAFSRKTFPVAETNANLGPHDQVVELPVNGFPSPHDVDEFALASPSVAK